MRAGFIPPTSRNWCAGTASFASTHRKCSPKIAKRIRKHLRNQRRRKKKAKRRKRNKRNSLATAGSCTEPDRQCRLRCILFNQRFSRFNHRFGPHIEGRALMQRLGQDVEDPSSPITGLASRLFNEKSKRVAFIHQTKLALWRLACSGVDVNASF